MPFNSGSIDFSNVSCPAGSTLEYSVNGGAYSTTVPTYPNNSAQTYDICVRCTCDGTSSPPACVTINSVDPNACCPDLSTAPAAPTVTNSTCS